MVDATQISNKPKVPANDFWLEVGNMMELEDEA